MKAPVVTIDVHHALTPEIRERIIENVRTRIQEPSYWLLSPELLRELARLDTGGPPLVSLYLQLTPERGIGRAWQSAFSALSRTISQIPDQKTRTAAEADLGQIEPVLSDQLPALDRGAAFFVCRERGIWRQRALPIPLPKWPAAYAAEAPSSNPSTTWWRRRCSKRSTRSRAGCSFAIPSVRKRLWR
jgi:hypothetical protein